MASVALEQQKNQQMFEELCNIPAELLESLEKQKSIEMLRRQRMLAEEENASRRSATANISASDGTINIDSTSTSTMLQQMSSSVICALRLADNTAQIVKSCRHFSEISCSMWFYWLDKIIDLVNLRQP